MTAKEAFEQGDFALARKLARGTPEEKEIFERTGSDPLMVKIAAACALFYLLIVWLMHGS